MLIQELKKYSANVPTKKIILDQMGPHDVSQLVLEIAAHNAVSKGSDDSEDQMDNVEKFIDEVIDNLKYQTLPKKLSTALTQAKKSIM